MAGENPQTTMPPVPREPLVDRSGQMSAQWTRWIQQIQRILSFSGGIAWAIINKAGSSLTDIVTRPHSALQSILGWINDTDASQVRHISNANGKKWEDHVDIIDGNPHGTDWDMIEGTASEIPFNITTPGTTNTEGVVRWNPAEKCLEYVTGLGSVEQINKDIWELGVNKTGGTAVDGKCVYASGVQGHRLAYQYADAREAAKSAFVGVVTASTADNAEGPVTAWGMVHGVDTSAWAEGTKLYVAADATGTLTSTAPSAPNYRVWVATVVDQHITQGSIFVAPKIDHGNGITFYSLDILTQLTAATAKLGGSANYTEVEADGTIKFNGDATVWRDDNFSAVSLGVGASPPDSIALNGGAIYVKAFDGAAITEQLFFSTEYNHEAKNGADIVFHVHWSPTTAGAGNVKWQLTYQWVNVDGSFAGAETTISVVQAAGGVAWSANKIAFPTVIGTGKTIGSQIVGRFFRDPTDAADTYAADAAITGTFGIHYELDTVGSRQILTK